MEIRATTILFAKRNAKQKRDEEKEPLQQFSNLQKQLRSSFNGISCQTETDCVKNKLKKKNTYWKQNSGKIAPYQSSMLRIQEEKTANTFII